MTLHSTLKSGSLVSNSVVKVVLQIADAIKAIHSAGWLHNDLKTNNILLDTSAAHYIRPVIIDFGLATQKEKTNFYWCLSQAKLEEALHYSGCIGLPEVIQDLNKLL
jgi:serine/threonine protein kinase